MNELLHLDLTATALAAVRILLGILFFAQAYDKVVTVGLKDFGETVAAGAADKKIPRAFITFSTSVSSIIELVGGALLILGLFLPIVYPLMALNLVMVGLGLSVMRPLWSLEHFLPRLLMLVYLMSYPIERDLFRLSELF